MILFHGSNVPGISSLRPFPSNHEKPYVYLTHSRVLAAIYAHNPMTRPNGFFTYWWGKDGILHYDEYFKNQMAEIYAGQTGYIYTCEGNFPQLEQMPWVYLADHSVNVNACEEIPDLYAHLIHMEREGLLRVRRWKEASKQQREIWENVVRRSLTTLEKSTPAGEEYFQYVKAHFPAIE